VERFASKTAYWTAGSGATHGPAGSWYSRYVYTSVGPLDTATGKVWTLRDAPGGDKAALKNWVPVADAPQ
jgi:hypothetical protein